MFRFYLCNSHLIRVEAVQIYQSVFYIARMDCPSEENLVRLQLGGNPNIRQLVFDIPKRMLTVFHLGGVDEIEAALHELDLGTKRKETVVSREDAFTEHDNQTQLLITVLLINLGFFIIELVSGLISRSMGLVADSLDMLADALVYGLSFYAVGGTLIRKKRIAAIAGYFQAILAILGFIEVLRRFLGSEVVPNHGTMIIVSILALIANGICLFLLQRSRHKEEAHMKASLIFTSNDVLINLGVIVAALLVNGLGSQIPDLVIGAIVFFLVVQGAHRILKLSR